MTVRVQFEKEGSGRETRVAWRQGALIGGKPAGREISLRPLY
jgi:hypothetical protein